MKFSRGAVMVETALFVSAALVFMLGTIQIGAIGFIQLTADGAAFYDARGNVLTVSSSNYANPEAATNAVFPQIPAPDIQPTVLPAATPAIPVDYGYNDPNAQTAANSATTRHGGASMMTPAQELVTVTVPGLAHILGQAFGANSSYIEPMYQECGTHFDIANVGCSLTNPPANSQTNYFSQGENTPPYMVGRNLLQQCNNSEPFGLYAGGNTNLPASVTYFPATNDSRGSPLSNWTNTSTCVDTQGDTTVGYISMGTAEFLHSQNWSDVGTGGSSSNGSGISGACDTSGGTAQNVFEAIAFHQRTYAALGNYFATHPEHYLAEFYSALWDNGDFSQPQNQLNRYYPAISQYSYNFTTHVYGPGNVDTGQIAIPEAIKTFENWEGFDDANYGPGGNDYYNGLVHTIYSWDKTVDAGEQPGKATYNNPTAPDNGCT